MSTLIALTIIFFASLAPAQILIQSPLSSKDEYRKYLQAHPQLRSYSHNVSSNLSNNQADDEMVFPLADQNIQKFSDFEKSVNELREKRGLKKNAWLFIRDYLETKKDLFEKQEKIKYQNWICMTEYFTDQEVSENCQWRSYSFKELQETYPSYDFIAVEAKTFPLKGDLLLPFDLPLKWTLLSDSHHELSHWGFFNDLKTKTAESFTLVRGTCYDYAAQTQDFSVVNSSHVFFSEDCVSALTERPRPRENWLVRNKNWLIPLGVVAAGAVALQLKDKKLVINTGTFK